MALSQLTVLAPEDGEHSGGSQRSEGACSDASTATAPELWLGRCATEEMKRGEGSPLKGRAAAGSFASSSAAAAGSPVPGCSSSVGAGGGGCSGGGSSGGYFGTPRPRPCSISGGESRASRMAAQRRARMQERGAARSASSPCMRADGSFPYQGTPRFGAGTRSTPVSPLTIAARSPMSPMAPSPQALGSASVGSSPLGGIGAGGRANGFSAMTESLGPNLLYTRLSVPAAASPSTEPPAEVKQGT